MKKSTRPNLMAAGVALILGVALVTVYFFPPSEYHFYPKCLLYQWTGLLCPGCGGTRAVHHLVHLRFFESLSMNALIVLFLPVLLTCLAIQKLKDREKPFLHLRASSKVCWGMAVLVIGFGVLRNLPIAPFTYLAPSTVKSAVPAR
jgi:hypothetical protein